MTSPLADRVTLEIVAGEERLHGEIMRAGSSFAARINGEAIGLPSGYDAAVARLVLFMRARLPAVAPQEWNVTVSVREREVIAEFSPDGLKSLSTTTYTDCVRRVLSYVPYATLSDAIEAASQLLAHCCRPISSTS